MAIINQDLIERIASKLGINSRSVYPHINRVASETLLERDLAALVLAAKLGINIRKYSTPEQRAQLAGIRTPVPNDAGGAPQQAPSNRNNIRSKRKIAPRDNSIFVVHGRNQGLRSSMFSFLRALGLKPMEWSHAVAAARGANPYIGDILDAAMGRVQAVLVLFSSDDEVRLKEEFCARHEKRTEGRLQGQARPNVLFEAGLALGRHPEKTLLVQVGQIKPFSDIGGKHMLHLTNDASARIELANRLEKLRCRVDRKGSDWMTVGDFTA